MGREIRRVPADWEHPRFQEHEVRYKWKRGDYHPMYNRTFGDAMREWYEGWLLWREGKHPDQRDCPYWEWKGDPPDPAYYRHRDWTDAEATHYQMYETVSEGTPVSPVFATPEGLIDYLVTHGDFWDQARVREGGQTGPAGWGREAAETFVRSGFAASLVVERSPAGVTIKEPRDGQW